MPKATHDSTTSRRHVLAALTGAGFAGGALVLAMPTEAPAVTVLEPSADAELIAVCAAFDAAEARFRAIFDGPAAIADDEEAADAGAIERDQMSALLDRMNMLRATTTVGIQARAHTLALYNGDWRFSFDRDSTTLSTITARLLGYLMRDAAALGGAGIAVPVELPDAKLLALLAEFDALERGIRDAYPKNCTHAEEEQADRLAEPMRERQHALLDPICQTKAKTIEGIFARRRSLSLWDGGGWISAPDSSSQYHDKRLISALVRDLSALEARV